MTAGYLRLTILPVTCAALLLLTACGTTAPTRFYLMNPMTEAGPAPMSEGNNGISIALTTVELPEHLSRPQMVTRQNGYLVRVDEFNRWAEPLEMQVSEILAENLSMLLGTEGIIIANRYKPTEYDFHLFIKILRFDGWPGKEATLVCRWNLGTADEPADVHAERFSATRPVEGSDYPDLVAALSLVLADLSREIAQRIAAE